MNDRFQIPASSPVTLMEAAQQTIAVAATDDNEETLPKGSHG